MKQKIEWYREVLEIEPNSKVFFPLARMLAEDKQAEAAIATLRQGVARHPDHIEARLLLVELLFSHGDAGPLWDEVDAVSVLLRKYPGFWKAWGERLRSQTATKDAGLAAIFMAAFAEQTPVSWTSIIEHGLRSVLGESTFAAIPNAAASAPAPAPQDMPAPATAETAKPEALPAPAAPEPIITAAPEVANTPPFAAPAGIPEVTQALEDFSSADEEDDLASLEQTGDDDDGEVPSLRTRSMADVLAEQGDIVGAIEIYKELIAGSSTETEKVELTAKVDELSRKVSVSSTAETPEQTLASDGKNRLSHMLEALAQRLEARSLQ